MKNIKTKNTKNLLQNENSTIKTVNEVSKAKE